MEALNLGSLYRVEIKIETGVQLNSIQYDAYTRTGKSLFLGEEIYTVRRAAAGIV